jgi:hypothetical protein
MRLDEMDRLDRHNDVEPDDEDEDVCSYCGKPCDETNDEGELIHYDCYAARLMDRADLLRDQMEGK